MSGLRRVLNGCLRTSIGPYSKTRSFQSLVLGDRQSNKSEKIYHPFSNVGKINDTASPFSSAVRIQRLENKFSTSSTKSPYSRNILSFRRDPLRFSASSVIYNHAYSSNAGNKGNDNWSATSEASSNSTDAISDTWIETLNSARHSVVDVASIVGNKYKELSDEVIHHIDQLYDLYPYLEKVLVPVTWTMSGTIVAWFVMPKVLRKFHKYASHASLSVSSNQEPVVYEKSFWSALEDPARYLITFIAFSQLGGMIAPTTLQYLPQAWRGAAVISFVWFLNRWKTNFFSHALASKVPNIGIDRDKLMTLEKVSSVGLLILGTMALAEACGVAVQSILTVGGVGGVATAFAARDILGNLLSGLSVQFSRPFTVGDYIKAGSIEGQVVEMGLTTTSLITPEKFPIIVPNSLFSSQAIINKSRAQWRASLTKIPVRIDDLDKIPIISDDVKSMLRSNPNVYLEKDAPYCYLSKLEDLFAELTVGCNLKNMKKDELYAAEQDILLHAAKIIKKHGAKLGGTQYDSPSR